MRLFSMMLWLLTCVLASAAWAQQIGPNDACRQLKANELGVARADISVDVTAVQVVPTTGSLCKALIYNTSTTNAVRCAGGLEAVPTSTAGFKINAGAALALELE